jgi:uncharacterized membrane protein
VKFDLEVDSTTTEIVDLSMGGVPDGWTSTLRGGGFVVTSVTAAPDKPGKATAEVQVAPDATAGSFPMTLTAHDSAGQVELPLTVDVQAEVDSGIGVKADFPSLRGEPGTAFAYTLTVTNHTPETQDFTFTGNGPQGWTVTVAPIASPNANTVSIDADASQQVKVTATPPDGVAEGQYPITVDIQAESGAKGTIPLTAEVTGAPKLAVSTADQRLDVKGTANHEKKVTLLVGNSGTGSLEDVKFAATPPSGWTVTFEPDSVASVKPNETTQVVAVIHPAKNSVAGDYAIGLRASAGSQSSNLDLRYGVQGSRTTGIIAIVVIVLVFVGLGFLFRRLGRR